MPRALPLLLVAAALSAGCDMANFAAGSTVRVIERGSPAVQEWEDPDLAEEAIPGSIGTMEAVLYIRPDDTTLRPLLARSYASYAFGFLQDRMEAALANDDETTAEHYRWRASSAYQRAKALGLGTLTLYEDDNDGAEGAVRRGIEAWTRYLENFDDEDQVPALFWLCYAWGQWIGLNRDNMDALADLPFVNALADRILEINPAYMDHAPRALHAGLIGTAPEALGGRPRDAQHEFDDAIRRTGRHNLMYLVMEARIVAIAIQDRALYQRLLTEVIEAGDVEPTQRLSNALAKRRATRYLAEIDMLFEPAGTTDEAPAEGAEGAEGEGAAATPAATP
jgi:hypothetical protein